MDIHKELACRDEVLTIQEYIKLAVRLDQLKYGAAPATRCPASPHISQPLFPVRSRPRPFRATRTLTEFGAEEPMQVDSS